MRNVRKAETCPALFPISKVVLLRNGVVLANLRITLKNLKGTAKATRVGLSKLNTLRGIKTAYVIPERWNEHPHHVCMGVPPQLLIRLHKMVLTFESVRCIL